MYERDKNVEKAESLERILIALDRLTDVVAKDETSKEILASLKDKGAKDVQEVPTASNRAEEIQYSRTRTPRQGGGEEQGEPLNFSTMRRLNDAFKSLGGDVGAFQRTLVTAINGGQKLKSIMDNPNLAAKALGGEGPMSASDFRKKYIADMGAGEYMNKLTPDMTWLHNKLTAMEKSGLNIEPGGSVYRNAFENARMRSQEKFDREVEAKYSKYKENLPRPQQGLPALESAGSISTLARVAAVTAIAAAPIVLGKLVQAGAVSQIEGARPFAMLNGQMANNFAMYDVNKMFSNMRIARGISSSVQSLMASETEFSRTMEPIKILSSNVVNSFLGGSLEMVNGVLKPMSNIARVLGEDKRSQAILQEMGSGAGIGAFWGTILGGLAGIPGGLPGIIGGAAWGAGVGAAGGAFIGGIGEAIGEKRMKELQTMNQPHKLMIDMFAIDIEMSKVCPAQRFVP